MNGCTSRGLVLWPMNGLLSRSCHCVGHRFNSRLNLRVVHTGWAVPPNNYSGSQWDSTLCDVSMIPSSLPIPLDIKKNVDEWL